MQFQRLMSQSTIMEAQKKWGNTTGKFYEPYVQKWSVLWEGTRDYDWAGDMLCIKHLRRHKNYVGSNQDALKALRFKWGLYLDSNPVEYFSSRKWNATPNVNFNISNYSTDFGY